MEYADGSTSSVVSDETWKLNTAGPVRANNEYDGEEYDARQEIAGWDRAGFRRYEVGAGARGGDSGRRYGRADGRAAARGRDHPAGEEDAAEGGRLHLRHGPEHGRLVPPDGGRAEGHGGGAAPCRDARQADGGLYTDNLRSAKATDHYILKGEGTEVWEPRFTYHGFRYVEVTGYPGEPALAALEGRVVHDDMTRIADFTTSNSLLNQIHKNMFWGIRGNYRSIPTDCPQRDERQGWLGDRLAVSRGESYMFDIAAFYSKWETDLADSQHENGSIPSVAPNYWMVYHDVVTWPATFIILPGMLYEQYGDRRVIERNYPAMKKWIDYMQRFMKDDIMPRDTYGDWCVPPESPELIHSKDPARQTDGLLLGTAYYYKTVRQMAQYARILGRLDDCRRIREPGEALARRLREEILQAGSGDVRQRHPDL